ncbi:smalltalk protein [Xylanibacter oryzae]|nr:smalltalk protein [Xylanibacter oryzae]
MKVKMPWGKMLRLLITVLTAIATTIGVTSCTGHGPF